MGNESSKPAFPATRVSAPWYLCGSGPLQSSSLRGRGGSLCWPTSPTSTAARPLSRKLPAPWPVTSVRICLRTTCPSPSQVLDHPLDQPPFPIWKAPTPPSQPPSNTPLTPYSPSHPKSRTSHTGALAEGRGLARGVGYGVGGIVGPGHGLAVPQGPSTPGQGQSVRPQPLPSLPPTPATPSSPLMGLQPFPSPSLASDLPSWQHFLLLATPLFIEHPFLWSPGFPPTFLAISS